MNFKNIHQSKTFITVVATILILIVLLCVFQAGIFVGYRKASFSYHFGDNYYRNFGEQNNRMMMGFMGNFTDRDLPSGHGAVGKIVQINLPNIVVADKNDLEKTIVITNDTLIKEFRHTISAYDLKVDDFIVTIGSPDNQGKITAKLIRLLPTPPANETATSTKNSQ